MENKYKITSFCKIDNQSLVVNGETVLENNAELFADFAKKIYQHFEVGYPKFYKMDSLSRLAFLASEIVLKDHVIADQENDIAIVFANKSASLDTDVKYQESIIDKQNYFPSPAVFVYTLPNICIGEISIKHKLQSENAFFVFDEFPATFMKCYTEQILELEKAEKVLCGWVELFQNEYKAVVYLVEKNGELDHQIEVINQIVE